MISSIELACFRGCPRPPTQLHNWFQGDPRPARSKPAFIEAQLKINILCHKRYHPHYEIVKDKLLINAISAVTFYKLDFSFKIKNSVKILIRREKCRELTKNRRWLICRNFYYCFRSGSGRRGEWEVKLFKGDCLASS